MILPMHIHTYMHRYTPWKWLMLAWHIYQHQTRFALLSSPTADRLILWVQPLHHLKQAEEQRTKPMQPNPDQPPQYFPTLQNINLISSTTLYVNKFASKMAKNLPASAALWPAAQWSQRLLVTDTCILPVINSCSYHITIWAHVAKDFSVTESMV